MKSAAVVNYAPEKGSVEIREIAQPDIGEEEIAEVADTLRSGWITTGPKAKRFEEDFTAFLGP